MTLGCHVPPASGASLICPSSQFNEPQEGLHGLSVHPWSVCQSSPALSPTLLGKQPSSLLGTCPCLPSCLLPAEASRWGLTCPQTADVPLLTFPSLLRAAWDGFLLGIWRYGDMSMAGQTALKGLPAPSLPGDHSGPVGRDAGGLACPQAWQLHSLTLPASAVGFGGFCPAHPTAKQSATSMLAQLLQ